MKFFLGVTYLAHPVYSLVILASGMRDKLHLIPHAKYFFFKLSTKCHDHIKVMHGLTNFRTHCAAVLHCTYEIFTARCTLVQSAELRPHVVCLSVLSVCDVGEL